MIVIDNPQPEKLVELTMLELKQKQCAAQIEEMDKEISRLEHEYESIRSFKQKLQNDSDLYCEIHDRRILICNELEAVRGNCHTADEYIKGCGSVLSAKEGSRWDKTISGFFTIEMKVSYTMRTTKLELDNLERKKFMAEAELISLKLQIRELKRELNEVVI